MVSRVAIASQAVVVSHAAVVGRVAITELHGIIPKTLANRSPIMIYVLHRSYS